MKLRKYPLSVPVCSKTKAGLRISIVLLTLIFILSMLQTSVYADENITSEEPLKILFIGNSFSKFTSIKGGNVGTILKELAEISDRQAEVTMLCHNAAHLAYYAFPSEKYESYYEEVSDALINSQWDYIVLQDYSKNGIQRAESEMFPAIRQLNNMVLQYQESAKVLLYATHGYEDGTSTTVNGEKKILTRRQMQVGVAAAYDKIGQELNLTVVPVGMMFWHCNQVYPSIQLYSADSKHPAYVGYYLAACTFYYQIFQELPKGEPDSLSNSDLSEFTLRCMEGLVDDRAGVSAKEATVAVGKSLQLNAATILDSGYLGADITWQSMDEGIASVGAASGKVVGVSEGTARIVAETSSGLQDFSTIHVIEDSKTQSSDASQDSEDFKTGSVVENPETQSSNMSMSFGQASYKVTYGDVIKILPVGYFNTSENDVTWSSSNKTVAVVSKDGMVTTLKPGRTTITVKRNNSTGIKASYVLYTACKAPQQVTASVKTGVSASSMTGKIKVKWKKSYGASSYSVYRASTKNGSYKKIATVTTNSYTDASAVKNKYWYYKVVAKAGYASTASPKSSHAYMMVPAAPKNLKASCGKKTIKITWTKNPRAKGYIIYRSTKKGNGYQRIAKITSKAKATYTDRTAVKGKTYYYRIRVYKKISGKFYYSTYSTTLKTKF